MERSEIRGNAPALIPDFASLHPGYKSGGLIQRGIARAIAAGLVPDEALGALRVPDRFAGIIGQKVLLGNIGDVFGLRILREQMIKRLILVWPKLLGNRQPPFLGIVEFRIDVENHASERKHPVADDLPDLKF